MKKRNKGKWHLGCDGSWIRVRSVCGTADCDEDVDRPKLPRLKDRCKLCSRIVKKDALDNIEGYFWYRRRTWTSAKVRGDVC